MTEVLTPEEQGRLLGAAVEGVAWALIDSETDTADRGVSKDHYQDAVKRAREILPRLIPNRKNRSPIIQNACGYCGWEHAPRDHSTDHEVGGTDPKETP